MGFVLRETGQELTESAPVVASAGTSRFVPRSIDDSVVDDEQERGVVERAVSGVRSIKDRYEDVVKSFQREFKTTQKNVQKDISKLSDRDMRFILGAEGFVVKTYLEALGRAAKPVKDLIKEEALVFGSDIAGETAGIARGAKLGAQAGAPFGIRGRVIGGAIGGVVGGALGSATGAGTARIVNDAVFRDDLTDEQIAERAKTEAAISGLSSGIFSSIGKAVGAIGRSRAGKGRISKEVIRPEISRRETSLAERGEELELLEQISEGTKSLIDNAKNRVAPIAQNMRISTIKAIDDLSKKEKFKGFQNKLSIEKIDDLITDINKKGKEVARESSIVLKGMKKRFGKQYNEILSESKGTIDIGKQADAVKAILKDIPDTDKALIDARIKRINKQLPDNLKTFQSDLTKINLPNEIQDKILMDELIDNGYSISEARNIINNSGPMVVDLDTAHKFKQTLQEVRSHVNRQSHLFSNDAIKSLDKITSGIAHDIDDVVGGGYAQLTREYAEMKNIEDFIDTKLGRDLNLSGFKGLRLNSKEAVEEVLNNSDNPLDVLENYANDRVTAIALQTSLLKNSSIPALKVSGELIEKKILDMSNDQQNLNRIVTGVENLIKSKPVDERRALKKEVSGFKSFIDKAKKEGFFLGDVNYDILSDALVSTSLSKMMPSGTVKNIMEYHWLLKLIKGGDQIFSELIAPAVIKQVDSGVFKPKVRNALRSWVDRELAGEGIISD